MRSFVALPIGEPSLDALLRLQDQVPVGRPVAEDNLHLTLAFLGDADPAALEALDPALETLAARADPVGIAFTGLDSFTERSRGLVFAAVALTPALATLQAGVARAARTAGLDLPRRRFRPHVTLTRARHRPTGFARDRLAALMGPGTMPGFTADNMALYRSDLHPDGARHEILAGYPLGG